MRREQSIARPLTSPDTGYVRARAADPAIEARAVRHARLERLWGSRDTARAFMTWSEVCALPRSTLQALNNDWAEIIGPIARQELHDAFTRLAPRATADLARRLVALDALFRAKTVPDPHTDPSLPWWWRRPGQS